ncbi:MAG: malonyl-CoA decarboxylase family protein [Novosphingobium sp.]
MEFNRPRQLRVSAGNPKRRTPLDLVMNTRIGKLLGKLGIAPRPASGEGLLDLAGALLSLRGKASGPALASTFFDLYEASDMAARLAFLGQIHGLYPQDSTAIEQAIARWNDKRDERATQRLHDATQSPCARLIGMLNLAPDGTRRLLAMRTDLLGAPERTPGLAALDEVFEDAFSAWFNAGFLEMRPISWNSSAALLERIIRYEAVHSIAGWDDLRGRLQPADRRCYGFFHPQMEDDPLIFVEVALTHELPGAIHQIIADPRTVIDPHGARCAIFYSISNCQDGLRGIPFGNYLIKRVVGLLQQELPQLDTFATLSPVPGFARWLSNELGKGAPAPAGTELRTLAARYLVTGRSPKGTVLDPVARFHLGNGARLEAVHTDADLSAKGLRQSHGVMVNYLYDLAEIEANHFALAELGTVAASKAVQTLLEPAKSENGKKKKAAA